MDTAALTADPVAAGADTDVEVIGADSQGPLALADRDRRSPRFSWTPAYEATFFQSLCDSVQLGLRENNSFKAEAWERAAEALQQQHGAYPTKSHLINKSDNARKRFRLWRGLRENPDFLYNSVAKTVTAAEETWRAHIEVSPSVASVHPTKHTHTTWSGSVANIPARENRSPEHSEVVPSTMKTTWRSCIRMLSALAVHPSG